MGVVKEVGEALNNYRYKNHKHGLDVPCIGICSWEYIAGTEQLENLEVESPTMNDDNIRRASISSKTSHRSRPGSIQLVRLNLD